MVVVVAVVDITEGLGLLVAMAVLMGSIFVVLSLSETEAVVAAVLLGDGDLLLFLVALSDMAAPLSVLSLRDS